MISGNYLSQTFDPIFMRDRDAQSHDLIAPVRPMVSSSPCDLSLLDCARPSDISVRLDYCLDAIIPIKSLNWPVPELEVLSPTFESLGSVPKPLSHTPPGASNILLYIASDHEPDHLS